MSITHADLPVSMHFRLEALAEGVYAAITAEGGGAVCNAGIVDLGDQALVFDTFQTPQAARDLRAEALQPDLRVVTYSHIAANAALHEYTFSYEIDEEASQ